jgi:2-polyprenyl-3-methyl-5-hydroxy-6-metoxy-1,4-benzoquinol methylase
VVPDRGTLGPDHPIWVEFARSMAPLAGLAARMLAGAVSERTRTAKRVLDIAAGHGLFGITLAAENPEIEVVAQDWGNVLQVAQENADAAGLGSRFTQLPGSAFEVSFGGPYDLVLLTNFLHHFDAPTCEGLLRKVRDALADGGAAITLEAVPDENRVAPAAAATFSLVMLATTPAGDAYTFSELEAMFRRAGFRRSELRELPVQMQRVVVSER